MGCRWLGALTLLSTVLLTGGAWAQETQGPMQRGVALNQFDPSPAGDDFFSLPSPHSVGETVEPRAKLVFDAASKPLRLVGEMDTADIVDSQIFMHVNVSMAFFDRLLIDALVPVAIAQSGDNPSLQGIDAQSPSSAEIADMRVGLRIRLYGEYQDPFQIGIGTYVFVPTGGEGSFVGEGSVRVTPYLTAGGRFNAGIDWIYTAYGGFAVRGSNNSSAMRYGAGFAADLFDGLWQIGPEFFASTPVQDAPYQLSEVDVIPADDSTNAELMLGTRIQLWHFVIGAAGGPGLTQAVGTPTFRLLGSIGYEPEPPEPDLNKIDSDDDGYSDKVDGCPYAYGSANPNPAKNGCPILDDDEDGVPNDDDACPDVWGRESSNPDDNGCPPQSARALRARPLGT